MNIMNRRSRLISFSSGHLLGATLPFDDEADGVPLVQDALELGHAVRARPLEGDLVGDAEDLHGARVARDLPVWDRDHVVQTQCLRWGGNILVF